MESDIDWNDTIKKEARGINGEDLGEVQGVSNDYVLVQRGTINKEKFYIPQDKVESYDGNVIKFRVSADEISRSEYIGSSFPAFFQKPEQDSPSSVYTMNNRTQQKKEDEDEANEDEA